MRRVSMGRRVLLVPDVNDWRTSAARRAAVARLPSPPPRVLARKIVTPERADAKIRTRLARAAGVFGDERLRPPVRV